MIAMGKSSSRSARRSHKKINKTHDHIGCHNCCDHCFSLIKEFSQTTSMHGIHFISQDDASLPERILWFILFSAGVIFSGLMSWELWKRWDSSPVLITIQSVNYPINNYPFPSITFCSTNKVSTRALGEWIQTREAKGFKGFHVDEIRRILQIISTNRVDDEDEILYLSSLMEGANISSSDGFYEKLMKDLSPNCSEMAIHCTWENKEENCADIFETESTDDGYCCSFNSIILYRNRTNNNKKLRYSSQAGVYSGLSVVLNAEREDYNVTSSSTVGFKFSIQPPDDFARTARIGFLASPGRLIDAAVQGETQISSKKAKAIDVTKRLCVLDEEMTLTYFEGYTKPYCQLDCLTKSFMTDCKCVPYYFPVPLELPVCNLSSYICLERVIEHQIGNASTCNCPEECNLVWYRSEISSGFYPNPVSSYPRSIRHRSEFRNMSQSEFHNYAENNFLQVNIYFQTTSGISYILDERMNWTNFLAATGGLLGLGFGFSILSFAEIIYFLGLRWIYYWQKRKKMGEREACLSAAQALHSQISYLNPSGYSQDDSAGSRLQSASKLNGWMRDDNHHFFF